MTTYRGPANERGVDPRTGETLVMESPRSTHVVIVRTGVWKNRVSGGGQGRPGKRKLRGYKKGFGYGGTLTPPKALGKKVKEEKVK